ncbi:hypothetical protein AMK59_4624 [Oryctes borbonicus]|uniref:Serpin domain-containing protein n=1 Tax=Oryctes borbonicus TaxID=1629725 RepID=A0A0T6B6F9_9SCAR|nr:hypothetical protein AMK59_4624 [Oryctes borbonicus]
MSEKALAHVCNGNATFSNELYGILSKQEGNVFYSPLSVHAILSLVYQGADGETAKSMAKGLHLSDTKLAAEGYQNLMEQLNAVDNVKLHIANKIFVHHERVLKGEFDAIAKKHYLAETENMAFAPDSAAAAAKINNWVKNKTNNKIDKLIQADDLDDFTRLVLVNAIYFKGDWMNKFDAKLTKREKFYLNNTDTVECDMMHINRKFRYGQDDDLDAQILSLPYKNPNLSLMIILPRSKTGIQALEKKLFTKNLSDLNRNLFSSDVILSMPKFKIETTMELKAPLTELGMGIIFSDCADFPNMLDSTEPLAVSKVIQKAFIEVNEEGAEAAAATGAIMMLRCSMPVPRPKVNFVADHPFIFVLNYEAEKNFPLFAGKLSIPSV